MTRTKHIPSKRRARAVRIKGAKHLTYRLEGTKLSIPASTADGLGDNSLTELYDAQPARPYEAARTVKPPKTAARAVRKREALAARIAKRQAQKAAALTKISATINGAPAEVIQSITLGGRTAYIVAAPETEDDLDAALGELATHRAAELASGDAVAYPASIGNAIFANIHPLRAIRDWRGHTQAELGALVESSGEYIGQLERGHRGLTAAMAAKLAEALDVPAEDLDPATWLDDED